MKIELGEPPIRVPGFRFAGVHCGIKESGRPDLALICADRPVPAALAFTTNRVKAAPVLVGLERARRRPLRLQAIVVNSGNANAFTGEQGLADARAMCRMVAAEIGIREGHVLPCSTGRIGVPLAMQAVERGIRAAARALSPDGFHCALGAILTTDAFPKFAVRHVEWNGASLTVTGMAKGAGMIAPNMRVPPHATLLAYLFTDAKLDDAALARILRAGLPCSFNAAVVDGDTSTNDTVVLLASGAAEHPPLSPRSPLFARLQQAFREVMEELARFVVMDGEGATRLVVIDVEGARSRQDAERAADAVARSPLCKAAFHGADPYMGRVVCALGYSGAVFEPKRLRIWLDDLEVVRGGQERVAGVEAQAMSIVAQKEFRLRIDLGAGKASSRRFCSDLTTEYVRFNSAYRT